MHLVAHNDGRELRGNERQLLLLALGLTECGHDVLVSCREGAALAGEIEHAGGGTRSPAGRAVDASLRATHVRPRGDAALSSALAFRRLIADEQPDAVLLTSWKRLFVGAWAVTGARRAAPRGHDRSPRLVARLGIVRRMPRSGWAAWKVRSALDRVDALVVNSEAVRHAWLESAPWFPPQRLLVIHNAVVPTAGDPSVLRRELSLPASVRLIATVAALEQRKGIDVLLRALSGLPAEIHAVIAGDGPDAKGLQALARSLSLGPRVHWLGARTDVPSVLAASAAFVLPTRQDSIPNALLEAMAAGVPVVTTAGNGAEEALAPVDGRGPAGRIVPGEDPAALAEAVADALGDSDDPRVLEARWRAAHWFGVDRMVAEYERVLFGP